MVQEERLTEIERQRLNRIALNRQRLIDLCIGEARVEFESNLQIVSEPI